MVRVAVYGASGYTGLELLRLLARHPQAEVTTLVTRQADAPHLSEVHPALTGLFDLRLECLSPQQVAERADCVFTCLPHGASAEVVSTLLDAGLKVVDLSADYRLRDQQVYEKWYGVTHPDPGRLTKSVYGLPELYGRFIKGASLIANPGCYPTSAILALAPLVNADVVDSTGIVIDSKSGVTGAGRSPKPHLHFPECNESFAAYAVGTHRHTPEIEQALDDACGAPMEVLFTPHLVPMDRGILSTCYATPAEGVDEYEILQTLRMSYKNKPFVKVVDEMPATKHVVGTNRCHLSARLVRGRVVVVSVIDNMLKGASGAAVQNFNLMYGMEETTALI